MSTELVAMSTITAADGLGMPVSTTHVLNSAVAGTMVANRSGLNFATVKQNTFCMDLYPPATICLSGGLYWLFLQFVSDYKEKPTCFKNAFALARLFYDQNICFALLYLIKI